jgi:hypothetical protein
VSPPHRRRDGRPTPTDPHRLSRPASEGSMATERTLEWLGVAIGVAALVAYCLMALV